jgi:2-keto-3-deoxy-L-rhamnonate aldolase RhmA
MGSNLTSPVDALIIGPADLRFDMGLAGFAGEEPEYLEAFKIVERAARANNLPIAGFAFGPQINLRLSQGWTLLMITADCLVLLAGQAGSLVTARNAVKEFLVFKEDANGSA